MKRITAAGLATALLAGLMTAALPARAEEPTTIPEVVNIEDPAGDANYLNGQGLDESVGDNTTPADAGSLSDILKVWFTHDADLINAHILTEGAPSGTNASIYFRVMVDPGGEANCLRFQGWTGGLTSPASAPAGSLRDLCGDNDVTTTEGVTFKIETGPDDQGIYTISVPRAAHPAFGDGLILAAPAAHSRNYMGGAVTAPQVDNTKPGTDYEISQSVGVEPKPTPPGKNDPPGTKNGCNKGKGKKKGCAKKPPKRCDSMTPAEAGAEAPLVVLKDSATEEKPVEQNVELGESVADLTLGLTEGSYSYVNVQVDPKGKDTGLYALLEFPDRRDYDLKLLRPDGTVAAESRAWNTLIEANEQAIPGLGPISTTGAGGGESTAHSEKLVGVRSSDCEGFTLEVGNYLGEGGELTVKLWLGEIKNEQIAAEPEA